MKFLFFKGEPLTFKLPLHFPEHDILNLDYNVFFNEDTEIDISNNINAYTDFSKYVDYFNIDSIFIFRKFKTDIDPLVDLFLKADFLGLNVNQYFLNKGTEKVKENLLYDIDFFDSNNMLFITDKISELQQQKLITLLIDIKNTYNKFYDND